jgi:signal transduction histidine kinase
MGLIAWIADAVISWYYFPGKSFFEMLFEHDTGRTLYVRAVVVGLFFIFGLFVGSLVNRLEQLTRLEKENAILLNQHIQKLHDFNEHAPIGIYTTTVGGDIRFVNNALARIFGAESAEAILESGFSIRDFYWGEKDRSEFLSLLKDKGLLLDHPLKLKRLNGEIRYVSIYARLREEEGDDTSIEGYVVDETEKVSSQLQALKLRESLEKSRHYESVAGLAAGVSHEFNNILQAMTGSAYLAQLGMEKGSTQWKYLQDIQDSGSRAAKLCDQMLTYAGKKALLVKPEALDDVIKSIKVFLRSTVPSHINFQMELNATEVLCRLELRSFTDLMHNLVLNAVESFPESTDDVKPEIIISTEAGVFPEESVRIYGIEKLPMSDRQVWLKIKDNGKGMTAEVLNRVFDPFFSTKFQGRGLGLATVKGLVKKFEGCIGVNSLPGQGTEFLLIFPVFEKPVEISSVSLDISPGKPETQHRGELLWVIDDEPLICETIERFVTRWGFEAETDLNGEDAIKRIREAEKKPSCILLDITMPKMGGLETLNQLRTFEPDVPVILMSGFDEEESKQKFQDHTISGFIHKPFQIESLQQMLDKVVS